MKKCVALVACLCLISIFASCNSPDLHKDVVEPTTNECLKVNDSYFAIDDINAGVQIVFNNGLYYNPGGYAPFLNKDIEYDLFLQNVYGNTYQRIYVVVTNMEHPLSDEQSPKLYKFGITITEKGLQSSFYEQSYVSKKNIATQETATYLGHYTMRINAITRPVYESVSDQWKHSAETAVRLYMDENDFCVEDDKNLQAGKYNIYIKGFSESDTDSLIVFEHENGEIYLGRYYFVHNISNGPADLNHVELVKETNIDFIEYISRIKETAALCMEYSVG